MDETAGYNADWCKSEREKQISYINTYYMESRKMVLIVLFEGTKGDKYIKNRYLVTVGEGEDGMTWDSSIEAYTWPYVK